MGALVTGQLGHKYADSLYGVYLARGLRLNFHSGERPWDVTAGQMARRNQPLPKSATPSTKYKSGSPHMSQSISWNRKLRPMG
jgi:microsomal epoxide hydrolase